MPDFNFDEMKKRYPGLNDDDVVQQIQDIDQPTIQGPDTLVTAPNPYKDMAIQNVKDKYGLSDKYSDAARQELADKVKPASSDYLLSGLAGLSAAFQGGNSEAAARADLSSRQDQANNQLAQFDTARKQAISSRDDALNQDKLTREMDPNSVESKMAQDLAVQMGMNPEQAKGLTAAKFKDFSPIMEKRYQVAEQAAARRDVANTAAQARQDALEAKNETKASDRDHKDSVEMKNDLVKGWAARSGQAGNVQGKITAAEAAQALIDQGKSQPGGLDSRQIEELAQSTGRLLGGTAAASARIEALVPHTLFGRAQTLGEWLSSKPRGQDMQAFTDRMAETVKREKQLAEDQSKEYKIQTLPAHSRLKQNNPDLYNSILSSSGIEPEMIDEKGRYNKRPSAAANSMNSASDKSDTKTVAGVNYKKVAGGWEEVP